MRTLLTVASCVLLASCSWGDSKDHAATPSPIEATTAAPSSPPPKPAAFDPCDLLTEPELEKLANGSVNAARPGLTGGLANCQWTTADGGFVQTIGSSSPDWSQALPDGLRTLEASGRFTDEENLRKLRDGAELVEAGQNLDPLMACSLFSEMLELQGRPKGSQSILTVVPTRDHPQGVTGQMCSGGRFTSVMVGNKAGLDEPLPEKQVAQALKSAHRKNLGY